MNLKTLDLKKAYSSDSDDFLNEFYIPALQASIEYNRLAGFFSSKSLAIAARGILGLIKNEGKMKLIMSPIISKTDLDTILKFEDHEKYIENQMLEELDKIEDEFVRDHIFALGWMLANDRLEIKVAIAYNDKKMLLDFEDLQQSGLFHQKVGILKDSDGNTISFSGSVNETAMGWLGNVEEFKVFRSWNSSEEEYVNTDISKFNRFWNNQSKKVKVIDVPFAVKKKLIKIAPNDIDKINLAKWNETTNKKIKLFEHQEKAIESWIQNGKKGIFEMATGTGKTFTALGCLQNVLENEKKMVVVIACPYDHLVKQWMDEIDVFGFTLDQIVADSTNPKWKDELANYMFDIKNGVKDNLIILTTHVTFASNVFVEILKISDKKLLLIADEVHGLGAPQRQKGLIEDYDYRLGLSATPTRWFDEEGTEILLEYFGGTVFEFSLKDAINKINPANGLTYLTPYDYKPSFVELDDFELEEYEILTQKITNLYRMAKNDNEKEKLLSLLSIKRQNIIKNANGKYLEFEKILDSIGDFKHCLIYCLPEQMENVQKILNKRQIIHHKFTLHEGTRRNKKYGGISEREFLLKKFADGTYDTLVAIKCLDEGVDVPPARIAIILASSGNPREYIQRVGRVLRRYSGKEKSIVYDILVLPTKMDSINNDFTELERKIVEKEFMRYKEFMNTADNKMECLSTIEHIENKYNLI